MSLSYPNQMENNHHPVTARVVLALATRDVSKPGGSFKAPVRRYAIGLGCEIAHAPAVACADDLDPRNDAAWQPIGISCRICERRDCHRRAVPPLDRRLVVDPDERDLLPCRIV